MDEETRLALKREVVSAYQSARHPRARSERIWAAWSFAQRRNVSVLELMANLPQDIVVAVQEDARDMLEGVTEEVADLGISYGTGPPVFDLSNPGFVPFSFIREISGPERRGGGHPDA